jgi:predicted outer membrane repeat protein
MGSYTSQIDFSGRTITIWGQEKVLDASEGGRFFTGQGGSSLLELHDVVLQYGYGAAIYTDGTTVEIYDSIFESNTAPEYGGALFALGNADVRIYTSTFESNSAGKWGGAIFGLNGVDAKIYTSTFKSNSAGER